MIYFLVVASLNNCFLYQIKKKKPAQLNTYFSTLKYFFKKINLQLCPNSNESCVGGIVIPTGLYLEVTEKDPQITVPRKDPRALK